MPNWAECRLWVDGDVEQVNDFFSKLLVKDANGEIEMDYSILVPLTEDGSYDADCAYWKWSAKWCGSDVKVIDYKQVEFFSPWSGPDEYVRTVSEMYPDLVFELTVIEGGMDFSYKIIFQNGRGSEIDGGTFDVLCEEFGYEFCSECNQVKCWLCSCECVKEAVI